MYISIKVRTSPPHPIVSIVVLKWNKIKINRRGQNWTYCVHLNESNDTRTSSPEESIIEDKTLNFKL